MNKSDRLSLISAIAAGGISQVLSASSQEVKEEASLVANPLDNDNSTLDEGQNIDLISPLMAERANEVSDKYGSEELELTRAERAEIGKGKLFKVKQTPKVEAEEESEVPDVLDFVGLAAWADAMTG